MATERLPVKLACRVLKVSESGYYARRSRPPSVRSVRHAWLIDLIRQAHFASRGTYGIRRVHAELTLGQGVAVGHQAVELLMRRAGIHGISGRPKFRPPADSARSRRDSDSHGSGLLNPSDSQPPRRLDVAVCRWRLQSLTAHHDRQSPAPCRCVA